LVLAAKWLLAIVSIALPIWGFFWAAGRWDWTLGWVYIVLFVGGQGLSTLIVWRHNPDLLRRRGRMGPGTKWWDKVWLGIFGLLLLATGAVAALDAGRYEWAVTPMWTVPIGVVLLAIQVHLITWAMVTNPFFEKSVRIQTELSHRVIDSGPYRFVRHPGYIAAISGFLLATPLLLRSGWAFVPAVAASLWFVVRTILEDRTLQNELPGYAEYAQRVRFRLIPGVW
jgi:protein-S-isoprenylcysteine O-methyltransferase Ste14